MLGDLYPKTSERQGNIPYFYGVLVNTFSGDEWDNKKTFVCTGHYLGLTVAKRPPAEKGGRGGARVGDSYPGMEHVGMLMLIPPRGGGMRHPIF